MNSQDGSIEDIEKRKKEYALRFLHDKDLITHEDNLISLPKAFMINSVIKFCLDRLTKRKITQTTWDKYHKIVNQYIAGIVDLGWDEAGNLKVIEVKNESKRKSHTKRKTKRD